MIYEEVRILDDWPTGGHLVYVLRSRILVIDTPVGEQLVFPMGAESAQAIGRALTAPSVEVPNGALV